MNEIKNIIVSYIKSLSQWGEALFQQTKELLNAFTLEKQQINPDIQYKIEIIDIVSEISKDRKNVELANCQYYSMCACFYSDLVIFDGSIEDNRIEQYQFAYESMKNLDHVLIVSRTDLPYNFEGRRKGGAPSWIKVGENQSEWDTTTDPEQLNTYILKWIKNTLNQLEIVRSNKLTKPLSAYNVMEETINAMHQSDYRMKFAEKSSLFISYLSKDFDILKACFSRIEEYTGISKDGYTYFAPGKIAKEFMTERRRWEIVSVTDREMHKCNSLLIFLTEGYYNSWWTMGEQISISYRFQDKWEECPIVYVAKVNLIGKEIAEIKWEVLKTSQQKQNFFPVLSEYQFRRLARRFANSDPNEAAYELDEKFTRQSKMPAIVKTLLSIMKGIALYFIEHSKMYNKLFGDISKDTLLKNISRALEFQNSYTHTEEFRTKRIVECKYCREAALPLTVDNFIQLDMPYVYHVDDEELIKHNDELHISQKCPIHGDIRLRKVGHYYRFIQPRHGKIMGSKKSIIEKIDTIEFY